MSAYSDLPDWYWDLPRAPNHYRNDPQYQIGWMAEGCRLALRALETIRASESTSPETRERLQLVADDLRQTLSVLEPRDGAQ